MHFTSLADMHGVTLVTSVLIWAFYFAIIKRYYVSFAFIVISWLGKENVSLITMFMGLFFIFSNKISKQKDKKLDKYGKIVATTLN